MRRILVLEALLVMFLISCTGTLPQGEATQVETETTLHQDSAPMVQSAEKAEGVLPMSEEEVLLAYDRAVEAWDWFFHKPLPGSGERVQVGDRAYWKVSSTRVETMEDLRSHLRRLFSQELTERLLDMDAPTPLYLELQGALYVRENAGRARDRSKGSQQIQVERETDTSYSVNVTVDLLDEDSVTVVGLEFWSFLYELVDDQWVFTSFRLIN